MPVTRLASVSSAARGPVAHQPPVTKDGHRCRTASRASSRKWLTYTMVVPAPRQCTDHLVQRLRLDVRQRRGRLVHDDHSRVTGDGAQDLDLLLVGGAELADQCVALELEAPARGRAAPYCCFICRRTTNPRRRGSTPRKTFSITVVVRNQRQFLGDQCDPVLAGVARSVTYLTFARPSTSIWPSSGRTRPPMILPSVDLPAPFAPTSTWTVRRRSRG